MSLVDRHTTFSPTIVGSDLVFRFPFYNSPATVDAQFMARPLRVAGSVLADCRAGLSEIRLRSNLSETSLEIVVSLRGLGQRDATTLHEIAVLPGGPAIDVELDRADRARVADHGHVMPRLAS